MATTSSSLTASCGENAQARPKARRAASALPPAPRKSPACRPEGQLASPSTEHSLWNRASTTQSDEPFHIANLRNQFADFPYIHLALQSQATRLTNARTDWRGRCTGRGCYPLRRAITKATYIQRSPGSHARLQFNALKSAQIKRLSWSRFTRRY